jgi:RNA polymerase subunit RPABC4/transcription elongation factor Spt4
MSKLSKGAFAVMAMCEETKKHFGITVDPRDGKYAFCWSFKINPDQAKREGYDKTHVHGAVVYDKDFNGCPYCGAREFFVCGRCGKIVCYHGQEKVTCPNCGLSSTVSESEAVDLNGGGF